MTTNLADKDPIYLELFEAIGYFLGRQPLVLQVIVEKGISLKELPRGVSAWYGKTEEIGKWVSDWRFRFHGGGCELKNLRTGEPIDWNGPFGHAFSVFSFINHLEWRLQAGHDLPLLREYVEHSGGFAVHKLIEELVADGVLTPDYHFVNSESIAA